MKKKQDHHISHIAAQNTGCEMLKRSAMKVTSQVLRGLEVDNGLLDCSKIRIFQTRLKPLNNIRKCKVWLYIIYLDANMFTNFNILDKCHKPLNSNRTVTT